MHISRVPLFASLTLLILALSACSLGGPAATPTSAQPSPTPTPAGPQTLNVCLGQEPSSLYLYADQSRAAQIVRQAIYDGPIDIRGYEAQPVILESIPSLENGAALLESVSVSEGQRVVDANGLPTDLLPGVTVRPAGCRDGDCLVVYEGGEISLDQLSVTFTLREGLTWSDGTELSASDSVYSFQLNVEATTPGSKEKANRTASYEAPDSRTVIWTGLPGYLDEGFIHNFWTPLPRHAWEALSASDLAADSRANRSPLGWGPYVIDEWIAGERIRLSRNPLYWRSAEGLPHFSELNFIFVGQSPQSNVEALANGSCDLLVPSTNIADDTDRLFDLEAAGQASLHIASDGSWQHLDFGVQPLSYDDGFNVFDDRTDFFGPAEMRQAFAYCVDRQALIDELAFGQGTVPGAYLDPSHPLANTDIASYSHDPEAGSALLDELGWLMGPNGVRVAQGYAGAINGTELRLTLHRSDDEISAQVGQILSSSLDECGIALEVLSGPAETIFAPGPGGPVFGRQFDLAQFAWPLSQEPACWLYISDAVPGADLDVFPYGWGGWNASGWSSADFDEACKSAVASIPGEASYQQEHAEAQAVFAGQLPVLPLYLPQQLAATRPDFCNFDLGAGGQILQDLEIYGFADWCN